MNPSPFLILDVFLRGISVFFILGGRHADVFFESCIKGRDRVEAGVETDGGDVEVLVGRIKQHFLGFFHAVIVDELKEILSQTFVDDLREVMGDIESRWARAPRVRSFSRKGLSAVMACWSFWR